MDEKVLSVIIPMYNSEKFIRKCLDSLLLPDRQMACLEVIVVDDGSTDRSAEYVKEYITAYPQSITMLQQRNGGHGSAVNAGVRHCRGKYFKVLDADDWVHTGTLQELVQMLGGLDAQVIACGYDRYDIQTGKTVPVRALIGARDKAPVQALAGAGDKASVQASAVAKGKTPVQVLAVAKGRAPVQVLAAAEDEACVRMSAAAQEVSVQALAEAGDKVPALADGMADAALTSAEGTRCLNMRQLIREWGSLRQLFCLHGLFYRTEFYRSLHCQLPEGVFYDDAFFFIVPCSHADQLCIIDRQCYVYRVGDAAQSISLSNRVKRAGQLETVIRAVIKTRKSHPFKTAAGREYWYRKLVSVVTDYYVTVFLRTSDKKQGRKMGRRFLREIQKADAKLYQRFFIRYCLLFGMSLLHKDETDFDKLLSAVSACGQGRKE